MNMPGARRPTLRPKERWNALYESFSV